MKKGFVFRELCFLSVYMGNVRSKERDTLMKSNSFTFLSFQTRTKLLLAILLAFFASSPILAAQSANIPKDVKETIRERLDSGYNVGIIVGIIDSNGTYY